MRKTFQVFHCEPSTVNFSYHLFPLVMDTINSYGIVANIHLHPNWMKFALTNNELFDAISAAIEAGHIIGIHHHGINHPTKWDGYTNVAYEAIPSDKKAQYIGTMADFEKIIEEFELSMDIELNSGSMTDEDTDFISRYEFSTNGIKPFEGLSKPKILTYNGIKTIQIGHTFIADERKFAIAKNLFLSPREGIFGCVFHVENYAAMPELMEDWFNFISKNGEIVNIYEACKLQ